jgi:GT2 family glycosyltransferase
VGRTISVVVPCYNEAAHITGLLDALREQTLQPAEIVLADCRSSDETLEAVAAYPHRSLLPPVHVVSCELRSTPMALNRAIQAAGGEVIVRLDGHSRPDRDYLRLCVQALDSPRAGVVGGLWSIQPGAATGPAKAIAVATSHPFGAGDALYRIGQHLTSPKDVDTVPFGCFRRALWEELRGFDEHFLANQDYEFNYRVRRAGRRVILDPRIRATYTARSTVWQLARQYFRYGWWRAETLKRHPSSLRWRQAVPAGFVATVLLLAALSSIEPRAAFVLAGILLPYAAATAGASVHAAGRTRGWALLPHLPVVFATIHVTWGTGLLTNVFTAGRWPARLRPHRLPVAGLPATAPEPRPAASEVPSRNR